MLQRKMATLSIALHNSWASFLYHFLLESIILAPAILVAVFVFFPIEHFSNLLLLNRGKSWEKSLPGFCSNWSHAQSVRKAHGNDSGRHPSLSTISSTVLCVIFVPVGSLIFANKALLPNGESRQAI